MIDKIEDELTFIGTEKGREVYSGMHEGIEVYILRDIETGKLSVSGESYARIRGFNSLKELMKHDSEIDFINDNKDNEGRPLLREIR